MLNPIIDNFTKNLKPCTGCGGMSVETINQIIEGKPMQFAIQLVVEAASVGEAITKISEGTVISVYPKPQAQAAGGVGSRQLPSNFQITGQHQETIKS